MTRNSSKHLLVLDGSSGSFRGAACDLGEVIALLHGGARPDPETLSRLCLSLRGIQAFLIEEAAEQANREQILGDMVITEVVKKIVQAPRVAMPQTEVTNAW